MKKKNKIYAVKIAIDKNTGEILAENCIVHSWDECLQLVWKNPSIYKSFTTEQECEDFFKFFNKERVQRRLEFQEEMKKQNTKKIRSFK